MFVIDYKSVAEVWRTGNNLYCTKLRRNISTMSSLWFLWNYWRILLLGTIMERTTQKPDISLLDVFCNFVYYLTHNVALSRPVLTSENLTICFTFFNIILNDIFRARVTQTLNSFYRLVFVRKYALFMLPLSNKDITLELCRVCFTLSSLCWLILSLFSLQLIENSWNIC